MRDLCFVRNGMRTVSPFAGNSSTPNSTSPMKSGDEAVSFFVRSNGCAASRSKNCITSLALFEASPSERQLSQYGSIVSGLTGQQAFATCFPFSHSKATAYTSD
eukprot:scaffold274807_cov28-Tisochrysis_lutea.AAC.3